MTGDQLQDVKPISDSIDKEEGFPILSTGFTIVAIVDSFLLSPDHLLIGVIFALLAIAWRIKA